MRPEKNLVLLILIQYFDHLFIQQVVVNMFYILSNGDTRLSKIESVNFQRLEFSKEGKHLNTIRCNSYYDRRNTICYRNL